MSSGFREHTENQELRNLLSPLRDAVLYARAKRRPLGIGQDFPRAPACVSIQLGAAYGRERDCVGFWIDSPEIGQTDADSPLLRIALCGYEGEHDMPASWECVAWKAAGGYGGQSQDHDNPNAKRERIWFSPHCLGGKQGSLF